MKISTTADSNGVAISDRFDLDYGKNKGVLFLRHSASGKYVWSVHIFGQPSGHVAIVQDFHRDDFAAAVAFANSVTNDQIDAAEEFERNSEREHAEAERLENEELSGEKK